jgi:alpha-acetolactate decarboxylase
MEKSRLTQRRQSVVAITVTETDNYLCFVESIEELYVHNPQQQNFFQPQVVEEWSFML